MVINMRISYQSYYNKIYGGWIGKCLGGAAGAPVEGIKKVIEVDDFRDIMNPELPNDDLDLQLLWLEVLQKKGPYIIGEDLAEAWYNQCWYPFSEYGYFLKNYERGIKPPYSGQFNNSFFYEGMGCPIRSEIWGFVFPGYPDKAVEYAKMDGELDHTTNSVWGEMFLAAIESMAFYCDDIIRLIEIGLSKIEVDSKLYQCIQLVLESYNEKIPYIKVREKILLYYGHPDFTNSVQNIGFIVLALLYGENNMEKTIHIALRCGYDTDCTCASAAAILGVINGFDKIDEELKGLIQDKFVIGIDVKRQDNRIQTLAQETAQVGLSILNNWYGDIITDIPKTVKQLKWSNNRKIFIKVEYINYPAVAIGGACPINIIVENNTNAEWTGEIELLNLPLGWRMDFTSAKITIEEKGCVVLKNTIRVDNAQKNISDKNIIDIVLREANEKIITYQFGICGMLPVKVHGIYTEQLEKEPDMNHPSPHPEGCILPSVECMCNNYVSLDKQYIDESQLFSDNYPFENIIHAPEDKIPFDSMYSVEGPICYYCSFDIWSETDEKIWIVVGNNDGFKIWNNRNLIMEKDEIRYWTPCNNAEIISLHKGKNKFVLKLLRRGKSMDFSIGFRKFKGKHFHVNRWITDLTYLI
jgi:ADP-ribosylglycohydrolase